MKSLKEYLLEVSILGDIDDQIESGDEALRNSVIKFIEENYNGKFIVSKEPNKNGLYEVSSNTSVIVKNDRITSLTNGLFTWTKVKQKFDCAYCKSLKSLEGAPKEVEGEFYCYNCNSLKSLEGAPEKVVGCFRCSNCNSLESLEGSPKNVGVYFNCACCKSLKSLEGAPEKVVGYFDCSYCDSLESLKGAPKEVGGDFRCYNCKKQFTEDDVKKVTNVKQYIHIE